MFKDTTEGQTHYAGDACFPGHCHKCLGEMEYIEQELTEVVRTVKCKKCESNASID